MTKKFARRFRLEALLFLLLAAISTTFYWQHSYPTTEIVSPASIIMSDATAIDQGVQVAWLEGQPGTYPVANYVIERSRGENDFERIARVENIFLEYLDTEGVAGDKYRVVAEDDRDPANRSPAGEYAKAAKAGSKSVAITTPVSTGVLGADTAAIEQAETPDAKAEVLQKLIVQTFTEFDTVLKRDEATKARNYLNALQDFQRQALTLWPQLSTARKASLAQACTEQLSSFETNSHKLPEDDHMDSLLVLASCQAIIEGAE